MHELESVAWIKRCVDPWPWIRENLQTPHDFKTISFFGQRLLVWNLIRVLCHVLWFKDLRKTKNSHFFKILNFVKINFVSFNHCSYHFSATKMKAFIISLFVEPFRAHILVIDGPSCPGMFGSYGPNLNGTAWNQIFLWKTTNFDTKTTFYSIWIWYQPFLHLKSVAVDDSCTMVKFVCELIT